MYKINIHGHVFLLGTSIYLHVHVWYTDIVSGGDPEREFEGGFYCDGYGSCISTMCIYDFERPMSSRSQALPVHDGGGWHRGLRPMLEQLSVGSYNGDHSGDSERRGESMSEERTYYMERIQKLFQTASTRELELVWRFVRAYLGKAD